jgi:hypothetical protein
MGQFPTNSMAAELVPKTLPRRQRPENCDGSREGASLNK